MNASLQSCLRVYIILTFSRLTSSGPRCDLVLPNLRDYFRRHFE